MLLSSIHDDHYGICLLSIVSDDVASLPAKFDNNSMITVLLSTPFSLRNIIFTYFFHSCASCSYALKYFCNVELVALNAILAGNDVT